jgi:5-oxoprolinase (ATP-hydrolysing) subunit A
VGGSRIDLNADLGERYDAWRPGDDEAVLDVVTTAHIACGFHSGDPEVMAETVAAAASRGVAIGAHPGYPDREGFGRRTMARSAAQIRADLLYQVGALDGIASASGARVCSVKPHGALYNRMAVDGAAAAAVAQAILDLDPALWLVVPAGSLAATVARASGVRTAEEAFCDRGYAPDGTLAGRGSPGALVSDADEAAARALRLVRDHEVSALDGTTVRLTPATLCVHGDTPGAAAMARRVRDELERAGVSVEPFS